MKIWIPLAVMALLPVAGMAQTTAPAAPAKPAAKPATEAKPSASRTEIKSTAKQLAAGIEAAEQALTPGELAVAERVHIGRLPCELGNVVNIAADTKNPGYFDVSLKNSKYKLYPVETTTGAIRLEDRKAEIIWLQLANKSMLINRKVGQRMADDCKSPAQAAVAEALLKNPAPNVLEAPAPAASAPSK